MIGFLKGLSYCLIVPFAFIFILAGYGLLSLGDTLDSVLRRLRK